MIGLHIFLMYEAAKGGHLTARDGIAPDYRRASSQQADAPRVLTKAVRRTADLLGYKQKDLARVLGISAASASRLGEAYQLDPATKSGELAVLFVRLYRSLSALLGGDDAKCRRWFHASNTHLGGTPSELVQTVVGLSRVIDYLDAMRGKL